MVWPSSSLPWLVLPSPSGVVVHGDVASTAAVVMEVQLSSLLQICWSGGPSTLLCISPTHHLPLPLGSSRKTCELYLKLQKVLSAPNGLNPTRSRMSQGYLSCQGCVRLVYMDLDEWESLSDLDFNEDGEKKIFLVGSESVVDMDYFFPSSPPPLRVQNQLVPLPILLKPKIVKAPEEEDTTKNHHHHQVDQDTVSSEQVFFKMNENEFVDMKIESPKSSSEAMEFITSPRRMKIEKRDVFGDGSNKEEEEEEECTWEEENSSSGFNIWKWSWSLTGVGAICTFGVAAATICVLLIGSQKGKKLQQDQKIRFQIYSDDKRIKQVVQHATKLNEAISAVRGVPVSRAHITVGGYYDGL